VITELEVGQLNSNQSVCVYDLSNGLILNSVGEQEGHQTSENSTQTVLRS